MAEVPICKLYEDGSWLNDFDVDCPLQYSYRCRDGDVQTVVDETVTASLPCLIGEKLHILTYPPAADPPSRCGPENLGVNVLKTTQDASGGNMETLNVVRLTEMIEGEEAVLKSEHIAAVVIRDQGKPTETQKLITMIGEKLHAKCVSQDHTKEGERCNIQVYEGSLENLATQNTEVQICSRGLKYGAITKYDPNNNQLFVEPEDGQVTNGRTRGALVTSLGPKPPHGKLEAYGVVVDSDERCFIAYPLKDALKELTDKHFPGKNIKFPEK